MVKTAKKYTIAFVISLFAIVAMFLIKGNTITVHAEEVQKNGLYYENEHWYYYTDGKINTSDTLVKHSDSWWHVKDGKVENEGTKSGVTASVSGDGSGLGIVEDE